MKMTLYTSFEKRCDINVRTHIHTYIQTHIQYMHAKELAAAMMMKTNKRPGWLVGVCVMAIILTKVCWQSKLPSGQFF